MKHMKYFTKYIIVSLIIVSLFIICYEFFKTKEGFNVKDIDNMFDDIKDITNVVGGIPKEINNVNNKLTKQVDTMGKTIEKKTEQMGKTIEKKTEQMGKEIEKKTINILTQKLGSIFTQFGDIFNKGIVKPILAVFNGIGNIFEQIFNILKEVSNKIISLPNCIITYAIKEIINTFNLLYNKILPKFLRNIISPIYYYTFRYLFEFIGYITGYNDSVQKCYEFNISSEVDNINSSLNTIETSFKKDFGQLDFSKIKI